MRSAIVVLALAGAVVAAGCSAQQQPAQQPAGGESSQTAPASGGTIAGTSWALLEYGVSGSPRPVLSSAPITAEFSADGKLAGNSGVNDYSTTYTTDGVSITIGQDFVTTKMAGPDDAMRQEADYLTTLKTAARYKIDDKSGQLVLFGPAGNMICRYNPAK